MVDVFISYARTERERAEQIKSAIEGLGLTIFFDVDGLDGGDVFPDVLDREVKSAGCVLGIWSPHALSRPWIKTECLIGKDRRVLIPVLVEPVNSLDVPAAFYGVQSIDLTDFAGALTHPGWIKLVRALARTLRRPDLIAALKPKPVQGGAPARPVKRYARWIAIAASLSALAAALFGWDANGRTKIAYCANVEEHWGVPSCVGRLDSQAFKKRNVSYQISTRGGRVVELARVNSRGVLTDASFDYFGEDWAGDTAQWQFSYRDDGKIASVVASDEYGRAVRKLDYDFEPDMGGAVVRSGLGAGRSEMFSARAAALGKSVEVEGVPSFASNSSVGQHRLTFDASGRVVRRMFEALGGGSTLVDSEGVAGRAYAYSLAGLPNEIRNLGLDGKPDALAGRVTIISATYTDRGDLASVEWRASNGHLLPGPSGSARVDIKRDAAGNGLEEQFYDANGAPVFDLAEGYARASYLYNDRGDALEATYHGLDGKITHKTTASRAAIERAAYDAKGLRASVAYFDVNGKPFLSRYELGRGAAMIQIDRNSVGLIVSFSFFGADGKPALAGEDCSAITKFKNDEHGRIIERSFWGTDGRPLASCDDGAASVRTERDNLGREVKERLFGLNGEPIISPDATHGSDLVYGERGNLSELIRVGLDGRPLDSKDGAIRTISYDSSGRIVAFGYFDAQRRPQTNSNGAFRVQMNYDERGNMIRKAFFGAKGEPIGQSASPAGVHSQDLEYNSRGVVLSETNRDVDNSILGSIVKLDTDERGRQIKVSCWKPKGQPADCTDMPGVHAIQAELDERGNHVKRTKLGADGQPAMSFGFAVATKEYSLVGDTVRTAHFDLADRPAVDEESGCSIVTFDYDDRGNVVKESCFSANGRPSLASYFGAAEITYEYDARNREVGEFTFGVDGKPLVTSKGYAGRRMAYDIFGARTEERYFGADEKPMAVVGKGYAEVLWRYDSFGYVSEARFIGLDGKLYAREKNQVAIKRWTKDIRGNATETRYYDTKEDLQSFTRRSFDSNNRLGKKEFFGANGKSDGWETYQYSKSGVCISASGFKADGKFVGEFKVQDQSECQ